MARASIGDWFEISQAVLQAQDVNLEKLRHFHVRNAAGNIGGLSGAGIDFLAGDIRAGHSWVRQTVGRVRAAT